MSGYPGGAALHIYDALYRQDDVHHILVRHEQLVVHAADGFSRPPVRWDCADIWSRGDQRYHWYSHRLYGFHPPCGYLWTGAADQDRSGRLP